MTARVKIRQKLPLDHTPAISSSDFALLPGQRQAIAQVSHSQRLPMRYVSVFSPRCRSMVLSAGSASAAPVTLDFEGIGDLHHIGSFYNGGAGGDLGVEFSSSAESLVSANAGGVGNFSNSRQARRIAFFDWGLELDEHERRGRVPELVLVPRTRPSTSQASSRSGMAPNGTGQLARHRGAAASDERLRRRCSRRLQLLVVRGAGFRRARPNPSRGREPATSSVSTM